MNYGSKVHLSTIAGLIISKHFGIEDVPLKKNSRGICNRELASQYVELLCSHLKTYGSEVPSSTIVSLFTSFIPLSRVFPLAFIAVVQGKANKLNSRIASLPPFINETLQCTNKLKLLICKCNLVLEALTMLKTGSWQSVARLHFSRKV